nr:hypothetical protein [Bacillaceae bacterium JMAK1]
MKTMMGITIIGTTITGMTNVTSIAILNVLKFAFLDAEITVAKYF